MGKDGEMWNIWDFNDKRWLGEVPWMRGGMGWGKWNEGEREERGGRDDGMVNGVGARQG